MYSFGQRSEKALDTCDPRLQNVMRLALEWSAVDFGIVQGSRTIEQQREYFQKGASRVNPDVYIGNLPALYKAAKHITGPGMPLSRACDIHVAGQPQGAYDRNALCYIAGVITAAAASLGTPIRWGGDFDQDGKIVEPGTFQDLPHFELL